MSNIHQSNPININGLLSRGVIEIPKYQRSYSWTREEVGEFLEDLHGAVRQSESWFLGIVYTYNSRVEEGGIQKNRSLLLDGQQRMTTMFILLKELLLYHEIIPDQDVATEIQAFANASIHSLIFETATENPRLVLDEANQNEFVEYLVGSDQDSASFQFFKGGPFAQSHELINNGILQIRSWLSSTYYNQAGISDHLQDFKKLVRFILYEIELIEIQLDNQASFHNIFENINDRGRRLTDSDKFKNRYCSLIPKNQLDSFETDWFEVTKTTYSLGKDLDDDLFGFYFRSIGEDDLVEAGSFYGKLRKDIHARSGFDKTQYVSDLWIQIKEMLKILQAVETMGLVKIYQGNPGNNLFTTCKVVNVLVRETWRHFEQFGVLVYSLFLSFKRRSEPGDFRIFLIDLLNAARFYISAHLSGEGANAIRPYTIEIAGRLSEGEPLIHILTDDDGRLDFAERLNFRSLDELSLSNNKLSKLLLMIVQAEVGRELLEHYDPNQAWTLEHLLPIKWNINWDYLSETDWSAVNRDFEPNLRRQLQLNDLNAVSKCWIQQLLGNKFVISWKQNNEMKNDGLYAKKERIRSMENAVVMPTIPSNNILDFEVFGPREVLNRTQVLIGELERVLKSKDLET